MAAALLLPACATVVDGAVLPSALSAVCVTVAGDPVLPLLFAAVAVAALRSSAALRLTRFEVELFFVSAFAADALCCALLPLSGAGLPVTAEGGDAVVAVLTADDGERRLFWVFSVSTAAVSLETAAVRRGGRSAFAAAVTRRPLAGTASAGSSALWVAGRMGVASARRFDVTRDGTGAGSFR